MSGWLVVLFLNMENPIRSYRRQKHLTQEMLAEKANLSVRTVQRAETNTCAPSQNTLEALAKVLETSPERLSMTYIKQLPEPVQTALNKISECLRDLSNYFFDHPEEIAQFGQITGTYVFQSRGPMLFQEPQELCCIESTPFHHANLLDTCICREETPKDRRIPGPNVSALINVDSWRPMVWRATGDFTLTTEWNSYYANDPFRGEDEIHVKKEIAWNSSRVG